MGSETKRNMVSYVKSINEQLQNYQKAEELFKTACENAMEKIEKQIKLFRIANDILKKYTSNSTLSFDESSIFIKKQHFSVNIIDFIDDDEVMKLDNLEQEEADNMLTTSAKELTAKVISILNMYSKYSFTTNLISKSEDSMIFLFEVDFE